MIKYVVEFRDVSIKLGKKKVLNKINLAIAPGEVIGIVGANGSGKTTFLRLVAGLIYPDKGGVLVAGQNVRPGLIGKLSVNVGALIESPSFLPHFSGFKNLSLLASIRGLIDKQDICNIMERVGLDPNNKKSVKTYSLGMRQRLGIAQAIMEKPSVLLLDEPTNGLDQDGVNLFSGLIQEQIQRGVAVLIVSHQKEEIDRLADRVFMIQDGSIHTIREEREQEWIILVKKIEELENIYKIIPSLQISNRIEGYPTGICSGHWANKEEMYKFLFTKGIHPVEIREKKKDVCI